MHRTDPDAPHSQRRRRWLIGVAVCVTLLGAYAMSLNWLAQRLGEDMEKSIRLPAVESDNTTSGGFY